MDKRKKLKLDMAMGMPKKTKSAAKEGFRGAKSATSGEYTETKSAAKEGMEGSKEVPAMMTKGAKSPMKPDLLGTKDASLGSDETEMLDKKIRRNKNYIKAIQNMK